MHVYLCGGRRQNEEVGGGEGSQGSVGKSKYQEKALRSIRQTHDRVCGELELMLRAVNNCSDSLRTRANRMSWEIL